MLNATCAEQHAVRVGVDELERPAEDVTQLVMQRRSCGPEGDARQVRAVEQVAPRVEIVGVLHHVRQRRMDGADTLERQRAHHRVVARCVQRLDRVGEGVERRGAGHAGRQRERQLGVVDDHLGQHHRVLAGLLVAVAGEPVDGRLLAAGVRRRHGHDRHAVGERDRLRQPGRRTAADADQHVGARLRDAPRELARRARPARAGRRRSTVPRRARRAIRPARRRSPSPRRLQ